MSIEPRRTFLKRLRNFAAAPMLMGGAGLGFGSTVERHRLTLEQHDLPLALGPKAPAKFRAVALTDFHFDPLYEDGYVQQYISAANALKPDIVFLTGDYITQRVDRMDDLAVMLSKLQQRSGIFACTGNHDHWEDPRHVVGCLRKQGIEVLYNQHTRVPCAGGELVIAGLASACDGLPNWPETVKGLKPNDRTIALMHEPDYVNQLCRLDAKRIALQLSGHTHGGQVCLPWFGAMHLPRFGRNYEAGFYDVKGIKLYVGRGLGTTNINVRLFCPPEITCFDITNTSVTNGTVA
jgi:predicted MPP superfamily phosphohydrolase